MTLGIARWPRISFMKRTHSFFHLGAVLAVAAYATNIHAADPSTNGDATLSVYSVRLTRAAEGRTKFGGRVYSSDTPGVQLQLLLRLTNGTLTAPGRDGISIKTFIDDTYQSLLSNSREPGYYQPP